MWAPWHASKSLCRCASPSAPVSQKRYVCTSPPVPHHHCSSLRRLVPSPLIPRFFGLDAVDGPPIRVHS
eukprot:scaffold65738_cov23-Tisochrysis_lutea.AAC.1